MGSSSRGEDAGLSRGVGAAEVDHAALRVCSSAVAPLDIATG